MFSLRRAAARTASKTLCMQCMKLSSRTPTSRALKAPFPSTKAPLPKLSFSQSRTFATKSSADTLIEDLQDQYGTARDEFEIATEETEKKSVYAAEDRAAAREELDNLKKMYEEALQGGDGEEVKRRIGQRIRELDSAVVALEQSALED